METSFPIRAKTDHRFYFRFLLIGVVALGFALWSLYDGAIGYPNQRERALEYLRLEQADRTDEWPQFAREQGWPTDPPGVPKTQADFIVQYIMAGIAGAIGLWLLIVVLRSRGRWIEASESRLTSSWGQGFDFDSVVSLDKKKWDKGIARVTYQEGNRKKRFVIDNYKFARQPTNGILCALEEKIDVDKIVGGPPETPPTAEGDLA
jgi:hypothetical protein